MYVAYVERDRDRLWLVVPHGCILVPVHLDLCGGHCSELWGKGWNFGANHCGHTCAAAPLSFINSMMLLSAVPSHLLVSAVIAITNPDTPGPCAAGR